MGNIPSGSSNDFLAQNTAQRFPNPITYNQKWNRIFYVKHILRAAVAFRRNKIKHCFAFNQGHRNSPSQQIALSDQFPVLIICK